MLSSALVVACGGATTSDAGEDGPPPTASSTPELRALVDEAEREGALQLSWAPGLLGDVEGSERLIDGFQEYYGLDIDVTFTPGSGQGEVATKVEQEHRADLPASTDVLSLNGTAVQQLAERGLLQAVDWQSFSPHVGDELIEAGGSAVEVQQWVLGIVYNTQRIAGDEAPSTMEDLLDPELEGRIYTTPFGGGFDVLASDEGWGRERTLDYARQFARQVGGLGFNIQPLLTGEFDVMALLVPPGSALQARDDGAPLELVIPRDAAVLYQHLLAVPVNAAHPSAARLFVDYLASPAGQELLREVDHADSPAIEGSLVAEQIAAAEADGAEFVRADVEFYARQDADQYQRNAEDILAVLLDRES